jgi:hypothetical protein
MNKVQTFRRSLMRRNFHLISSVGYEIPSSRIGVQDADSAISLIRAAGAAGHRRARGRSPGGRIRQTAAICRIAGEE